MLKAFNSFIDSTEITNINEHILIGLSGGRDSIFMANMFIKSGYKIAVAHCNFNLRDKEADNEQAFVENFAKSNNLEFHTINFNTKKYASDNSMSIQMAARELRYNWFEKIRTENNFNKVAIAHNKNDSVETFLINLTRGTGIKGLTGIKPLNKHVIRPILFAERKEITDYLIENKIKWKDDSSNNIDKYTRNNIRLNIIPEFEKMNSNFVSTMSNNIDKLNNVYSVYNKEINFKRKKILINQTDRVLINIEIIKKLKPLEIYLYEFIKGFNFTPEQIHEIIDILNSIPGKQVHSPTHRIIKDREYLIITELNTNKSEQEYIIEQGTSEITIPINLHIDLLNNINYKIPLTSNISSIDFNSLEFPLKLRKWRTGDKFMPFGMSKFKKLSDFFKDNKLSVVDKENVWLLSDRSDNIVWIVNNRTDNRYRITDKTTKIIQLSYFS